METYAELKQLVVNPYYFVQRKQILDGLSDNMIDAPIIDLIKALITLPYCFTLQSCYGHFVYKGQNDIFNCEPLPLAEIPDRVKYRIAYVALCLENSAEGKGLYKDLIRIPDIDPDNIQFCCAEWFWKKQVNSFALQVESDRFKDKDTAELNYREAFHIERIRDEFFVRLEGLVKKQQDRIKYG